VDNELVIEVEPKRFEEMAVTALDGMPEEPGERAGLLRRFRLVEFPYRDVPGWSR
jgi:hypothetical protein